MVGGRNEHKEKDCLLFYGGLYGAERDEIFMRKINANAEYIQLCPTKTRRSAEDIKNRYKNRHTNRIAQNGYTGDKLIEYVMEFIGKDRFKREKYDAILMEDDKDERFLSIQPDGTGRIERDKWEKYKESVIQRIHEQYPNVPVVFLLAAPEAEAWFLADWDNGFGSVFKSVLTAGQNNYFAIRFRKYVNEQILTAVYMECIEEYGYFEGVYRKLSEEIQASLKEGSFWETSQMKNEIPQISYSKRIQGEIMMEQINPEIVRDKCSVFFRDGFYLLQKI